jgi:hypothetical protein
VIRATVSAAAVAALIAATAGCGGKGDSGPKRAPSREAFGVELGTTGKADVQARLEAQGYECSDKSARVQARLSCVEPGAGNARKLFVFLEHAAPVALASHQRSHDRAADGLADFTATVERIQNTYGGPTSSERVPPPGAPLPLNQKVVVLWEFADLVVELDAISVGTRVNVIEDYRSPRATGDSH